MSSSPMNSPPHHEMSFIDADNIPFGRNRHVSGRRRSHARLQEEILRVQPDVKKVFLLVRAADTSAAEERVLNEVVGNELFGTLREKYGSSFHSFTKEKISPLAGDIIDENLGLESPKILELSEEIDIIVNGAATTNFYERYDVALASNVLGTKYVCKFANKCPNLKMFLHVSTAYVAREQQGLLLEKPFRIGEMLKQGCHLDIDAELKLVDSIKAELMQSSGNSEQLEKTTMKKLGLKRARHFGWPNTYVFTKAMGEMLVGQFRGDLPVVVVRPSMVSSIYHEPLPGWIEGTRTIDSIIAAYAKQAIPCFIGHGDIILDVIPGDMVVNAMVVAMAIHWSEKGQVVIHVTSSRQNPLSISTAYGIMHRYFSTNPQMGNNGRVIKAKRLLLFKKFGSFRTYMFLKYKLPSEMLHMVNSLLGGSFSRYYNKFNRSYSYFILLAKLYAPYCFFNARFNDTNLERLQTATTRDKSDAHVFDFDPKSIDWDYYFYNIHIPGVLMYAKKK
ncbi:alcohol-forming fatty acyl-CoA reductase-like isoform X2 [Phragmites australis]|uniref:alcohol-forming fatty acyl-CoA reductase-like isoform X2 n=1 Tax=Phragmites australis TaxID=29695 RepID=UPI002D79BD00|nr:alcohol-forming fatty acyl-CoA reductase-like isoform X2 [Phragmites australis]